MTTMSDRVRRWSRFYLVWAAFVIAGCGWATWRGGVFSPERVTGVPKSVRNNPGSYRSVYIGGRIIRGK
jgi:hypothetical protein